MDFYRCYLLAKLDLHFNFSNVDMMIYHNDCMYISHFCLFGLSAISIGEQRIALAGIAFRKAANEIFRQQVTYNGQILLKLIAETKGFDLYSKQRYEVVVKAVSNTVGHLRATSSAWLGALPLNMHHVCMGQLIEVASGYLNEYFERLGDISEDACTKLHALLGTFTDIVECFGNCATVYTAEEYDLFKVFWMLLKWSLSDILGHFRDGKLKAISSKQLVRMIEGLFAESAMRRSAICEILK